MIEKRRSGVEKFDWLCSSISTFLVVKWSFDHQWFWIYTVGVHKVHHKPYFSFFKIIITVLISSKWSKTFQKIQNFENFHVFSSFLEKSYCCRWRYVFTDFLKKSFNTWKSNFNPKKNRCLKHENHQKPIIWMDATSVNSFFHFFREISENRSKR